MSNSNPAAGPASSASPGHSLSAMFILCSIYALIGIGAGFWLGRHGFNQTFKPAVPTTPSAAAVAEQDADAAKRNNDRVAKEIQLLQNQEKTLDVELNEDVIKKLAEKELGLGGDPTNVSSFWEGKRVQYQRLIETRTSVLAEISGIQGRRDDLARRIGQRLALPQVETQIQSNPRYADAVRYADDAARQLDYLKSVSKPDADAIKSGERRNTAAATRLSAVHDELLSSTINSLKGQLEEDLNADTSKLAQLDKFISQAAQELGTLSQTMIDYRVLQEREKRLRDKLDALQDRISELRLSESLGPPAPNLLRTSLPSTVQ